MKLKINNCGCHFNQYNLLSEGINRYTKKTSISIYFESVLLLKINSKEIFEKKENVAYTNVFISLLFSTRGERNYLYDQQQVHGLFCNH